MKKSFNYILILGFIGVISCGKENKTVIEKEVKIIKTMEFSYSKAPYFETIMPMIERLIRGNQTIAMLNYHSIIEINRYLGVDTEIFLSSEIYSQFNNLIDLHFQSGVT